MKKIVINTCWGGFSLSDEAIERLLELGYPREEIEKDRASPEWQKISKRRYYGLRGIPRDHPLLIQVVEELGSRANGTFAELKIVEIPDDVEWVIEKYDGWEWVSEVHRTWS